MINSGGDRCEVAPRQSCEDLICDDKIVPNFDSHSGLTREKIIESLVTSSRVIKDKLLNGLPHSIAFTRVSSQLV